MKRRVRFLALFLTLALLLPAAAAAAGELPFADVPADAWYYENVCYAWENGLMNGVSQTQFSPGGHFSRAMAATILHRAAGRPEAQGAADFADVPAGAWYAEAVAWAQSAGVVNGRSETSFAPDADITRAEFAVILSRYLNAAGLTLPAEIEGVPADLAQIPDWAADAVCRLYRAQVITGRPGGVFDPDAPITRAEAAALLERFLTKSAPEEPAEKTLPVMYIETENAAPIVSKENYIRGSMTITNADAPLCLTDAPLQIRGRGNYSWTSTEKKSYRVKFDSKVNLLGQGKGKAKSWTLLAIHCDKSLLRTEAAFYFASKLDNLPFVSSSSFVELYLNGEYLGVYEVCDQIQVNACRVDIDDSGTGTDIGYLVELDQNASEDVIRISNGDTFEVKSDYVNQEQLDFIADYLSQCIEAIESGDRAAVEALIDVPSAVDAYLVEEYMKNLDVGWGSFYFAKPAGGKLRFGPVWDFDLCAGNAENDSHDLRFKTWKYTYVGNPYFDDMQQSNWFLALRRCDWFNELVAERWAEARVYADETVTHIGELAEAYQTCFERNFERWPIFSTKINREPYEILRIRSFMGQVNYLKDWLTKRANWLSDFYDGKTADVS